MATEENLLNKIIATTRADRHVVVAYLKLLCNRVKNNNQLELLQQSGTAKFREPTSPGELIASQIQHVLLQQEYVNWDDDTELAYIQDIAGSLISETNNRKLWHELFERIDRL